MTYLTGRAAYRSGLTGADELPNAAAPLIRLDLNRNEIIQNPPAPIAYGPCGRAYNGHLELFVELEGSSSVWEIPGTPEIAESGDFYANIATFVWAGDTVPTATSTGHWVLVDHRAVTCNTLIALRDIPAGAYKVLVSDMSNGVTVNILEQHTE